ncbi:hypothetical protein A5881_001700 [Enterococcus termitis]|nr:hypothetical protein A5881_001976 [Enterococcus termitis]
MISKKLLGLIVLLSSLVFFSEKADAISASQEETTYQQPSGQKFKAVNQGNEFYNYLVGENGAVYTLKQDGYWYYQEHEDQPDLNQKKVAIDPEPTKVLKADELKMIPTIADNIQEEQTPLSRVATKWNKDQNLLVLLVEFSDYSFDSDERSWSTKIFSDSGKSVNKFYKEATNSAIQFVPAKTNRTNYDGIVKVKLDSPHPDYKTIPNDTTNASRRIVIEALKKANDYIDFASYDTNGNDVIEQNELHIMTIIAGYEGSNSPNSPAVWGHKSASNFISYSPNLQGKIFTSYTQFGEKMRDGSQLSTIGVICHELGHDLNLPDLYNTQGHGGLGSYSVMASGAWEQAYGETIGTTPSHFDAYSKMKLGLVEPTVIEEDSTIDVNDISTNGLNILRVNTQNPKEYFLIENRQLKGFDSSLKTYIYSSAYGTGPVVASGGIAIYHINENYTRNFTVDQQLVRLKEADEGLLGYSRLDKPTNIKENRYDGFFYKGKGTFGEVQPTTLSKFTIPSTTLSDGTTSERTIEVLSEPNDTMKIKITKDIAVSDVKLDKDNVNLDLGEEMTLKATIEPKNATHRTISWKTDDESIATVDKNGVIKGIKEGTTKITVTTEDGKKMAVVEVKVTKTIPLVKGIYGTVPWAWNPDTQVLTFGEGTFPDTSRAFTIKSVIEESKLLNNEKIKKIVFTKKVTAAVDSSALFNNLEELTEIEHADLLDTSNTTNMSWMFYWCKALETINLQAWDTHNVTNMSAMFCKSDALTSVEISQWDTSNVTQSQIMFEDVPLALLDISGWDTTNLSDLGFLRSPDTLVLGEKSILKKLGLPEKIEYPYTGRWISDAQVYESHADLIDNYDGSKPGTYVRERVTTEPLFGTVPWKWDSDTQTLTFGEGTFPDNYYDGTIKTEIEDLAFLKNKKIKKIVFTKKVTAAVNSFELFSYLFELSEIENIDLLDTSNTQNMSKMFYNCQSLKALDLQKWDTHNVTNMDWMFGFSTALKSLELSKWNTSNVTSLSQIFRDLPLTTLDISGWDTTRITNSEALGSLHNLDTLVLGEKSLIKGSWLNDPHTGRWISDTQIYESTDDFMNNYDGSKPGIYVKEKNNL